MKNQLQQSKNKNAFEKSILLFLFFFLILELPAQIIRTSITNGKWSNPATWSPVGVPTILDSVIVNSNVTLDMDINLTNGKLVVNPLMSLREDVLKRRISFLNAVFKNKGTVSVSYINVMGYQAFTNDDSIFVKEVLNNNTILITNNKFFSIRDSLNNYTGDFKNYGIVTTDNFIYNSGSLNNDGKILVQGDIMNTGVFNNNKKSDSVIVLKGVETYGVITNYGVLKISNSIRLFNTGKLNNSGIVTTDNFLYNNGGAVVNSKLMKIMKDLQNDGYFSNDDSLFVYGKIRLSNNTFYNNRYVYTPGSFNIDSLSKLQNYGIVTTDNFISGNGQTVTYMNSIVFTKKLVLSGNVSGAGTFCVSDSTIVSGSISGFIDICDATPPSTYPPIDVFTGTVAPTVTFCMRGICLLIGVNEYAKTNSVTVFPNPVSSAITINLNNVETGDYLMQIHNLLGQLVYEKHIEITATEQQMEIPLANIENGAYLFSVSGNKLNYKTIINKVE